MSSTPTLRRMALRLITALALMVSCAAFAGEPRLPEHARGAFLQGDYSAALEALQPAITAGDRDAAVLGGLLCAFYLERACDRARATERLVPIASEGDPHAQFALAVLPLSEGAASRAVGVRWLDHAAKSGLGVALVQKARLALAAGDDDAAAAALGPVAEGGQPFAQ